MLSPELGQDAEFNGGFYRSENATIDAANKCFFNLFSLVRETELNP
jgi:hypothetical protein